MRRWNSQPSIGRWIAIALLIIVLLVCGLVGARLAQAFNGPPETWEIDLTVYGLVVGLIGLLLLAGTLAYRAASAFTLAYELDRNGLYIVWLGNRAVVPLERIQSVDLGVLPARMPWRIVQGVGYYGGQGRTADGRRLHVFSTQPLARALVIYTPEDAYAISPADHEAFVQDLEQRRNLGATKPLAAAFEPGRMFLYDFWNDSTVRVLLLVVFALNLLALGVLAARYPLLEPMIRMRFDAAGQVSDLRPRHQVLFLPLAAFGLSLFNLVAGLLIYRSQQVGARLLQGASVVAQLLFGIAAITIVR
jgi:hypothetical protein